MLDNDVFDWGIGVVLSQKLHPIAYLNCTLALKHMALPMYDKEIMAIVYALQQWQHYLISSQFTIITNHQTI